MWSLVEAKQIFDTIKVKVHVDSIVKTIWKTFQCVHMVNNLYELWKVHIWYCNLWEFHKFMELIDHMDANTILYHRLIRIYPRTFCMFMRSQERVVHLYEKDVQYMKIANGLKRPSVDPVTLGITMRVEKNVVRWYNESVKSFENCPYGQKISTHFWKFHEFMKILDHMDGYVFFFSTGWYYTQ